MRKLIPKFKPVANRYRSTQKFLAHTFEGKATGEFLSEASIRRRKRIARYTYNVVFAFLVAIITTLPGPRSKIPLTLRAGEVAEQNILAPLTAQIESREIPALQRRAISRKVPPTYDYDDGIHGRWTKDWQTAFHNVREQYYNGKKVPAATPEFLDTLRQTLYDATEQTLLPDQLKFLHKNAFSNSIEKQFVRTAERLSEKLVSTSDLLATHSSTGVIIRHVNHSGREILIQDLSRIWSLEQAQDFVTHPLRGVKEGKTETSRQVLSLVSSLIPANLQYNASLTQKRIDIVLASEKPPTTSIRTGQVLVRRGERVSEPQSDLLDNVRGLLTPQGLTQRMALTFAMLLIFMSILLRTNYLGRGFWHLSFKDCLLFLFVTLLTLTSAKIAYPYIRLTLGSFGLASAAQYLLPMSAGAIVVHLLMGKEAGHAFAFLLSVVTSFMLDQSLFYTLWMYVSCASAIQSIRSCKQRTDLYKSGVYSGFVSGLLLLAFSILQGLGLRQIDWFDAVSNSLLSFFSGFLGSIITSVAIPVLESIAGYTTSLKLLELSNFNHPLLHSLMMKAPGTYHHSIIVGSLAEIAAERVNSNGLLARVSAYYHDIGKMGKPMYFIENQTPNNNPHDQLAPTMSAKILFSHVKNGARLSREYHLGKQITDIIEQHHGTTLVSYFFNKAKQAENPEVDPAKESDFRYPGPKPQSREAAIVMLADACEAATRSIAEPTPAKIQGMVKSIINRRFLEEQFHECDLTFHDLQVIEDNFTRTLVSLYHHRIEYPGQKKVMNALEAQSQTPAEPNVKKGA